MGGGRGKGQKEEKEVATALAHEAPEIPQRAEQIGERKISKEPGVAARSKSDNPEYYSRMRGNDYGMSASEYINVSCRYLRLICKSLILLIVFWNY